MFPNIEKLNSFVETLTPYKKILIFEESRNGNVYPVWIFGFSYLILDYTEQAQISSAIVLLCYSQFSLFVSAWHCILLHLTNENKQWAVLELLPQILLQMMRCIEDMDYNLTLGTHVGSVRG
jgi:hypothetical protein